ncbi:MAG: nucleotidyltransferase family protein [Halanaeroarchaeum sp.]
MPVLEPPAACPSGNTHIVGILLAAGDSSRFGDSNKLLGEVNGRAMVTASATTLCEAQVDTAIAVVSPEAERVRDAVPNGVGIVETDASRSVLSTSVSTGVRAARKRGGDAVLFALGDMPWVERDSVEALVAAYRAGFGSALAAACDGERGNPVIFGARHFDRLSSLSGDVGGRAILGDVSDGALIETNDPGVIRDIDTPADLRSG